VRRWRRNPLAAGILAFMFVQVALPACRIRVTAPVPGQHRWGYYWIQLVLVGLVGYRFSRGAAHLPSRARSTWPSSCTW
jgi:hypothetical protein